MRFTRVGAFTCAALFAATLAACGGSRGTCGGQSVPLGPIPAGTPIPAQPLPANSGVSTDVWVGVAFTVNSGGTVTAAHVRLSSGSTVVDAAAVRIVEATPFKIIDTNCEGQPIQSGYVVIDFSPNAAYAV